MSKEFETALNAVATMHQDNKPKHTLGPWQSTNGVEVPGQKGSHLEMPDSWIGVICSDQRNGDVVAYCHPDNADLIAAAPELKEGIQQALNDFNEMGLVTGLTIELFRSLISLSEGR